MFARHGDRRNPIDNHQHHKTRTLTLTMKQYFPTEREGLTFRKRLTWQNSRRTRMTQSPRCLIDYKTRRRFTNFCTHKYLRLEETKISSMSLKTCSAATSDQIAADLQKRQNFNISTVCCGKRLWKFSVANNFHGDEIDRCVLWIEKGFHQRRSKRNHKKQLGSGKVWSNGETLSDLLKRLKAMNWDFQDNPAKFIQTFLFGILPINNQQDLLNNNEQAASSEKKKAFLHRRQQYNHFAQAATPLPFHRASMNLPDAARQAQQQQPVVKRHTGRFDGNCFYCDKNGHSEVECRQKALDGEDGTVKQRECKPAN